MGLGSNLRRAAALGDLSWGFDRPQFEEQIGRILECCRRQRGTQRLEVVVTDLQVLLTPQFGSNGALSHTSIT